MTAARKRFTQEFKDELCREVINTSKPIKDVADAYGVSPETLRNWLIKYRDANGGAETELTVPERARLKELEREVASLCVVWFPAGERCFGKVRSHRGMVSENRSKLLTKDTNHDRSRPV